MRGADILVQMLIGYGVETIFGVPGDTNVPFYEALQQREGEIRHVMARDERSAGYMADAYGRFSNKPGVFECPSGAGAMYSLPPVAEIEWIIDTCYPFDHRYSFAGRRAWCSHRA